MNKPKTKQAGSYTEEMHEEIQVQFYPAKHGTYKADLFGPIHSPAQFSQIVTVLEAMKEEDELVLYLSSPGGSLDAVDSLIHAMQKTEGNVHVIATGDCSSAATLVLLSADSFELSEGFESTIHCGSLGYGGNFNEVTISAPFQLKRMEAYLRRHYEFFLEEDEINSLLKGQDILLDAQGWVDRAQGRINKMQAKMAEMQNAARKASRPKRVKKATPKTVADKSAKPVDTSDKPE
jgi:ATP-dependent protease ClpP protease subunit